MELPQSRPFGTEGRKATHDFLSLYSPIEQDPKPPQGGYLKTHDFLQPLDQARETIGKRTKIEMEAVERPPSPAPRSAEHILPGGIGTFSISYMLQKVPKPETNLFSITQANSIDRDDRNSNCSSYSGSGFTLWNDSSITKGKTGKENLGGDRHAIREAGVNVGGGQPTTSLERQSQLSSNHNHNTATLSTLSSTLQPLAVENQSFLHMITSAKNAHDEDDDEEEEFVVKQESPSFSKGNLSVKADGRSSDQKPNTPRSKHSATEQRRRSKINDRFVKLREIIPHSDQKRDKASFLLEVIEYVQFLQEKVHKYEGSYQCSEHKPSTLPWNKCYMMTESSIDHSQGTNSASSPALICVGKFDENKIGIPATCPVNRQAVDPNRTSAVKESSQQSELTNNTATLCMQPNAFAFCGNTRMESLQSRLASDAGTSELNSQSQLYLSRSNMTDHAVTNDKPQGQEVSIEGGTISISSVYSKRLLNTLTQALQHSGVDLSKASISVQIDLGKRANDRSNASASNFKGDNVSTGNQPIVQFMDTGTREESVHAFKRLKTS